MTVPISAMTVVWSDGALHTAIKMSVTDTASNAASLLMDLQVGGVSKFNVVKDGSFNGLRFIGNTGYSGFDPSTNALGQVTIGGSFGGGIVINDSGFVGLWSDTFGTRLNIGVGGTSGGIPPNMIMTSSNLFPNVNNGMSLGLAASNRWGGLALASGAATDWNNSNVTLTHSAGALTFGPTGANLAIGTAAIATNATDGFLYIPTCAGTPTGTPTTFTGRVPMIFDTTNSQFWFFTGGAWKQPKTPAGAATVTWQ